MAGIGAVGSWPIWAETMVSDCPRCGEAAFVFVRSCPACGAARKLQTTALTVAGALALLLIAVAIAAVTVVGWHQLAAATETGDAVGEPVAAGAAGDPSWLAKAMSQCDAEAKADADTLHFLITPLVPADGELASWRAKAINDSGNGIMLRSEDAFDGLRRGSLRLYAADYGFGVLDAANNLIYRWRPSVGVAKFTAANPGEMPTFMVQFRTAHTGSEPVQGGTFNRQNGACYWVNAIMRE
jgi:hypothetical protein